MAINIEEYKNEDSPSWYNFPDGTNIQGREKAQAYADELEEFDTIAEEEAALDEEAATEERERVATAADEHDGDGVVTSADVNEREVADAADGVAGDEPVPVDNKNTPYDKDEYLIEMTRQNRLFEYPGENKNYVFRHNAKILVVEGQDVGGLLAQGGFRIVTPQQAKEYYS